MNNTVHILGEKRNDERGRPVIWAACDICGFQRWVRIEKGKPRNKVCTSCHGKSLGKKFGEDNPNYRHGLKTKVNSYIAIRNPIHPLSWQGDGRILRSRFNLEQALGRPLKEGAHVHHINRNVQDDRPENLMELIPSEHSKLHQRLRRFNKRETSDATA